MSTLRNLLFGSFCLFSSSLFAQTSLQEISANKEKSGGNYYAYPTPSGNITPAPAGYSPFYISHYGRHGSRYMLDGIDAKESRDILRQAEKDGKLTKVGKQTLLQLDTIINEMDERYGELTQRGHGQHKAIARRMFANYPEIFSDSTVIDARSTVVNRCILSMSSFCQQLMALNPKLKITNNASQHDMFFMCKNSHSEAHKGTDSDSRWQKMFKSFCDSLAQPQRLMSVLFTKPNYVSGDKAKQLSQRLYNIAADVQDMDQIHFSLLTLFSDEELFNYWQCTNAYWYGQMGLQAKQETRDYEKAANLLRNIIDNAQIAIAKKEPSVTLRFGHDSGIMPLIVLMHVGNSYCRVNNLSDLYKSWSDYKLVPMGANFQLVFYRNVSGNVLVKAMLNEEETTLPIKSYSGPYYQWNDVLDYYEEVLSHIPNVQQSVNLHK